MSTMSKRQGYHFKKILGTRQAADVGGQDSVRAAFHCASLESETLKPHL